MIVRFIEDPQELEAVYRLRYAVYVTELGNEIPHADHQRQLLFDDNDKRAAEILGVFKGDRLIGTARYNPLTEYQRDELPFHCVPEFCWEHPAQTVIPSMLMVHPDWRRSRAYFLLLKEGVRLQVARGRRYALSYGEPHNTALYEKSGFEYLTTETIRHPLYRDVYPMIYSAH